MSRAQQGQIFDTATAQNATENANAQTAFTKSQADVGTYQDALAKFASADPYVQGGQYATSQNQTLADTANAGANATAEALQTAAVHGGANPAQAIAASEEIAQQNQRSLGTADANANQTRIGAEAGYNEKALGGYQTAQQMQDQLANQQGQLANSVLGTAETAAQTPSFMDELGQGLIGGAGAALCPAQGTLYLMADATEAPVERLKAGDEVMGIDGAAEEVLEIQTAVSLVLRVETEGGHSVRVSRAHAFALPRGGFVEASDCLGKTVVTGSEGGRIKSVMPDGEDTVYNVITNGSHTYRANGYWSLGVGEAERATSMNEWDKIADAMPVKTGVA